MDKQAIKNVFDNHFKFTVGDQVRHKGDMKSAVSADMGMLILARMIHETIDDEGEASFQKTYHCRVVKYSGSGEVVSFAEKELLSVSEWNERSGEEELERSRISNEMRQVQKEVYEAFGVTKESRMYLINAEGEVDKSVEYRPAGFSKTNTETKLTLRSVARLNGGGGEEFEATSPAQFELS